MGHRSRFARVESVRHDLSEGVPDLAPVDLVLAGLVLEYVDRENLSPQPPRVLNLEGVLVAVLQPPPANLPEVSVTPFASLGRLEDSFRFVDPTRLRACLRQAGFVVLGEKQIQLPAGKSFHRAEFRHEG